MTVAVLKTCADSLGGLLATYQASGDALLLLSVAESMLACAQKRDCDSHAVCAERAIEIYRDSQQIMGA